jgi:hypothetical protein
MLEATSHHKAEGDETATAFSIYVHFNILRWAEYVVQMDPGTLSTGLPRERSSGRRAVDKPCIR